MTETINDKTVKCNLTRLDVCDLSLACTVIKNSLKAEGHTADKWIAIHDKLQEILKEFDEEQNN